MTVLDVQAARTVTPLILALDAVDQDAYKQARLEPISFIVATVDTAQSVAPTTRGAREYGAITAALYSADDALIDRAAPAYVRAGVAQSVNLTGGIFVNQSAAFSDYHVSGANPAGNAYLTDAAFVASRFDIICVRCPAAA